MSYEAMPCVLKNEDGTPMYGLLIKPVPVQSQLVIQLNSAQQQQQHGQAQQPQQQHFVSNSSKSVASSSSLQFVAVPSSSHTNTTHTNNNNVTGNQSNGSSNNNNNCKNATVVRRHYPTILPRETLPNTSKPPANNWNSANATFSNLQQQNFKNSKFFTQQQQQQQQQQISRTQFPFATATSSTGLHNQVCQQTTSYGFLSQLPSQSLPPDPPIIFCGDNVSVNNVNAVESHGRRTEFSRSSSCSENGTNQQQQLQQQSVSNCSSSNDLDSLLRDIDLSDLSQITNSLLPLLQDDCETTDLINSTIDSSSTNVLNADILKASETLNNGTAARPPCRYQGLLSSSTNLRVGAVPATSSNSTIPIFDPAPIERQQQLRNNCAEDESAGTDNNYMHTRQHSRFCSVQATKASSSTHSQDFDQHGHEATTPDSGIQSIGDSPQAAAQSSPMQFFSSSPGSHQQQQHHRQLSPPQQPVLKPNGMPPADPYTAKPVARQRGDNRNSRKNDAPTTAWNTRFMQPLSVNTCYEPISDCDSSPTMISAGKAFHGSSEASDTTDLLNTPRCRSDSTTACDSGRDSSPCSREGGPQKKSSVHNRKRVSEFDDMPILKPEGDPKTPRFQPENERRDIEDEPTDKPDSTEKNKEQIPSIEPTCFSDADALVEKLLSVVPKDKLADFRRILDERLNGNEKKSTEPRNATAKNRPEQLGTSSISPVRWQTTNNGYASDASSASSVDVMRRRQKEKSDRNSFTELSTSMSRDFSSPSCSTAKEEFFGSKDQAALRKLMEYRAKARSKCVQPTLDARVSNLNQLIDDLHLGGATTRKRVNSSLSACFQSVRERLKIMQDEAPKLTKEENQGGAGGGGERARKLPKFDSVQNLEIEASSDSEEDNGCVSPCPQLTAELRSPSPEPSLKEQENETVETVPLKKTEELVEITENPQRKNISVKIKLSLLRNNSEIGPTITNVGKGKRTKANPLLPPKKRFKGKETLEKSTIKNEKAGDRKRQHGSDSKMATGNKKRNDGNQVDKIKEIRSPKKEKVSKKEVSRDEETAKNSTVRADVSIRRCSMCKTWIRVDKDDDTVCNDCRTKEISGKETSLKISKKAKKAEKTSKSDTLSPRKAEKGLSTESTSRSSMESASSNDIFYVERCQLLNDKTNSDDFRLPYDIWWQNYFQKNFVCSNPSENYRKLRSNVYIDAKPTTDVQIHTCSCKPSNSTSTPLCGDECLNRMMFTECSPNVCPCGERCANRRFQQRQWTSGLQRFQSGTAKGAGVRTTRPIKSGAFVCEYLGEVVSAATFGDRMRTWYKDCTHHYALKLDAGTVIDSYRCGSIARFINHACQPNCEMQKWCVNGQYRMGVFALRDVEPGEELTYNYKFHAYSSPQACLCGGATCRGFVGGGGHQARKSKPKHVNMCQLRNVPSDSNLSKLHLSKPLSHRERAFVIKRALFLLRNVDGVRRKLQALNNSCASSESGSGSGSTDEEKRKADIILSQLTALKTARCIKTRRLTISEDNVHMQKLTGLAQLLKQIVTTLIAATDMETQTSPATIIRKKQHEKFENPTDFHALERNVERGFYMTPEAFDRDVISIFTHMKTQSATSENGVDPMSKLEHLYETEKLKIVDQLRDALGFVLSSDFIQKSKTDTDIPTEEERTLDEMYWGTNALFVGSYETDDATGVWAERGDTFDKEDDKVHCLCGICEEEGLMIQCDQCRYWQHCDCVDAVGEAPSDYVCEFCVTGNHALFKDVVLTPQPDIRLPNCVYYRTLMKEGLQVRIGECVYVKRNIDEKHKQLLRTFNRECVQPSLSESEENRSKSSHENDLKLSDTAPVPRSKETYRRTDLRVFRVERLFTGPRGVRFVFGSYFARPHETFCEPSRRFYRNEIFVTPLYDTLPLDAVVGRCLVVDTQTFCKGRPRYPKYAEEDIYICEYRLDKGQRLFDKMHVRNRYPINTKPYIFQRFAEKMVARRDFTPFNQKEKPVEPNKKGDRKSKNPQVQKTKKSPPDTHRSINNRLAIAKRKGKRLESLFERLRTK